MRLAALLVLVAALGCASEPSPEQSDAPPRKRPPRHTWDDDELHAIDFPEQTTPAAGSAAPGAAPGAQAKPREPLRPNVKLALAVYDVISWDDVKIRGGLRGSSVKGVVSLTGWLAKAKSASRTELLIGAGREGQLDVAEPLRSLVGDASSFKVAVLDSNTKGELDLAVTSALAYDDPQVAAATRVHLAPGEAVVVGGHRSEEGDSPKVDRLVLIEATTR